MAVLTAFEFAYAGGPYTASSDDELTRIAAGWDRLSQQSRRALLTEVRERMTTRNVATPMVRIQTQRRYGRIIRQPDGSVLHIERREQSVEYRRIPVDPNGRPYGIGFEHRVGDSVRSPIPDGATGNATGNPPSVSVPIVPVQNNNPG